MSNEPSAPENWRVDKTISLSHIVSTLMVAVSVFIWASALERRVDQNATGIANLKDQMELQIRLSEIQRKEFRQDLQLIGKKLDRLIENGTK